jgi:hypothetical protein
MNIAFANKIVTGAAWLLTLLWTLTMAVAYGLLVLTDDLTLWLNEVLNVNADVARWLTAISAWLAHWGGWLLVVVWGMGVLAVFLLARLARRMAAHVLTAHDTGGPDLSDYRRVVATINPQNGMSSSNSPPPPFSPPGGGP